MGKMKFLISSIVVFSVLFSCSNEDDVNNTEELPTYSEIAGNYRLVSLTSNYPIDYNADGSYETNLLGYVSCNSSIKILEEGRVIWNYLDYFGGIGVIFDSNCTISPNSQIPNSCRLNNGIGEGLNPYELEIVNYEMQQLNLGFSGEISYTWKLSNNKIEITQIEPLAVAYLYDGNPYPNGFGCSPGDGIYLTYTFQKQ